MDAILTDKAQQLASEIATQAKTLEDLNGVIKLMMKSALERMLDTELDVHLGRKRLPGSTADSPKQVDETSAAEAPSKTRAKNRRNGHSQKTVQGDLGEIKLTTPRDRDGTFEPQLIPKHQRRLTGFSEKILALYAKGMTTRDIQEIVKELYDVDVSATLISEITADLDAQVSSWRNRQLDPVWPIVYLDGIVVHVRSANGRVLPQTMYVALGVNMQGHKELLGLWLNETEGAKFWLSCLTDLKNRGLKDIFIACIDGLSGFADALHAAYPEAKV
jgi:putative transposase